MTHPCCRACAIRVTQRAAASEPSCPCCAEPLAALRASEALGSWLWIAEAGPAAAAAALAVALPDPRRGR